MTARDERQTPVSDDFDDDIREVPSHTPDFRTELAEQIAHLVPEAVADGKIDVEKLRELLDEDVSHDGRERFGLTWPGKSQALKAAQSPTTATLVPDREASKDWDTTKNIFIEGDNLEVLKILQKHYHGKIKMIYIDPPYNTGKDFIYPDNYKDGLLKYLEWTKQVSEEGKKLSSNPETAGRYHSNWLNMIYPRLKLARNLLRQDGIIFVSIDDHEVASLRLIMDDIFGEQNLVETYIWESTFRPDNSSKVERENAQYLVCYARDRSQLGSLVGAQKKTDGLPSLTMSKMPEKTVRLEPDWVEIQLVDGLYGPGDLGGGYTLIDQVIVENNKAREPFRLRGRIKWSQEYIEEQVQQGTRIVIKGSTFVPYSKKNQTSALPPTTLLPRDEVGDILAANADIRSLFGTPIFSFPKPVTLLKFITNAVTHSDPDAIVLDFFSGSSTTAHAVMQLNAEDGGSRSHIQVQLPEPVDPSSEPGEMGFATISQVSRERIRRAGEKIKEEFTEQLLARQTPLDVGFRSYSLSETNFVKWRETSNSDLKALEQRLAGLRGSADDDATPAMLLTELLLKQGYSLAESISEVEIAGLKVWSVAEGALFALMDEHVKPSLEQLRSVIEAGPVRLVILEDVLAGDDQLKTNLVQHAKTHGVDLWSA